MSIHFPNIPATYRNVPKTGTTSFKWWAREHIKDCEILDDPDRPQNLLHLTLDEIKARWATPGTTFTFVRNPYDRAVSIFHHVGQDAENRIKDRKAGIVRPELLAVPIEVDIRILSVYRKGFDHWITNTQQDSCASDILKLLNQKESQLRWLNYTIPDVVIKLENINQDFVILQDLLGCHVPPLHINTSNHKHYLDYYTPASKQIVAELFKEDFEAFGYDY
jgi:hypothetical protein